MLHYIHNKTTVLSKRCFSNKLLYLVLQYSFYTRRLYNRRTKRWTFAQRRYSKLEKCCLPERSAFYDYASTDNCINSDKLFFFPIEETGCQLRFKLLLYIIHGMHEISLFFITKFTVKFNLSVKSTLASLLSNLFHLNIQHRCP